MVRSAEEGANSGGGGGVQGGPSTQMTLTTLTVGHFFHAQNVMAEGGCQ